MIVPPAVVERFSPLRQALACGGLSLAGMVVCHFLFRGETIEFVAAFTGIVLYSLLNAVISVFHESFMKYTWPSWMIFVGLLVVLLLSARYMSGVSIYQNARYNESGTLTVQSLGAYRMMLGSVVAFYLISSLLVRLVRTIWEFAEADEN